jgi:hypothetical protein
MNSVRLAIAIMLTVAVSSAHADPIPIFHVTRATMNMGPNTSGDNLTFVFTGPGVEVSGIGGMGCFDWCTGQPIPVDTAITTSQIFLSNLVALTVGGVDFSPFLTFDGPSFFDADGGLNPLTTFFPGDALTQVKLTLPTGGGWRLNFARTTDQEGNPAIFFVNGTFSAEAPVATPEPATIGLVVIGSAGIRLITSRKRRFGFSHRRSAC